MTAKPALTESEIDSLAFGFLTAAEFADCASDNDDDWPGISEAEWSDDARRRARDAVMAWHAVLSADDWQQAQALTIGHQDFDFDKLACMGADIYYGAVGHAMGFQDRKEYPEEFSDRLYTATQGVHLDTPYLGDDGLRYFS